jgi:hypothetical protein
LNQSSFLRDVLNDNIDKNKIKELDEMHIRWENQLDIFHDENKIYSFVKSVVGNVLQLHLQRLLKDHNLSAEQKSYLLDLKKLL